MICGRGRSGFIAREGSGLSVLFRLEPGPIRAHRSRNGFGNTVDADKAGKGALLLKRPFVERPVLPCSTSSFGKAIREYVSECQSPATHGNMRHSNRPLHVRF
jgi:hypothetical protein